MSKKITKNKSQEFLSEKTTLIIFIFILLIGSFLRLYNLELRPAHFDEGGGYAHGVFDLLENGHYIYNPDFHGPFLFHITALVFYFFGANDFTLRITEALFGIGVILLLYLIRKEFTSNLGFLTATVFLSVSSSLVYYSRFAVHDSYFVFFTFAIIVSFILLQKTKNKLYAYLLSANVAFLFTVKENAYIVAFIFSTYLFLELLYDILFNSKKKIKKIFLSAKENKKVIIISFFVFFAIFILLFTSFFRNLDNFRIAVTEPVTRWLNRVDTGQGFYKPISFYTDLLKDLELPILVFGILGIILTLFERKRPIARFLSYWAVLTIAIYFYIPYKMPNLFINITLPLALVSGIFVDFIVRKIREQVTDDLTKKYLLISFLLIILILSSFLLYVSYQANFINYNNEPKNKLVYVQTLDDIRELLTDVERASVKKTGGKLIDIDVSIPQTEYPLSWYWHYYPNVRFYNKKVNVPLYWKGFNWAGDGIITWTSLEKKNGVKSMKISSSNGSNANFWQKIPLKGGLWYEFSGWIKTEGIEKVGIVDKVSQFHIRLDNNDAAGDIIKESKPLYGTNNWTQMKLDFFMPKTEKYIWISCVLANWGKAKGTIWFDDLVLKEKGGNRSGNNLIPNGAFELGNKLEDFNADIIVVSENDGQILEKRDGYLMKKYTLRPTVELAVYFKEGLL